MNTLVVLNKQHLQDGKYSGPKEAQPGTEFVDGLGLIVGD